MNVSPSPAQPPTRRATPRPAPRPLRAPGPSWALRLWLFLDRTLPNFVFRPVLALGTWLAVARLHEQRRHSRDYLRVVLGREPRLREVFAHFFAFSEMLALKLRVARGHVHPVVMAPGSTDFENLIAKAEDVLLGTFHFGHSDLVGFLFSGRERRRVSMVRLRVANSSDVELLGRAMGEQLSFIWVDEGENLLFALKDAVAAGGSLAMKCDRLDFSARTEPFRFLGARRLFPFTIYHLAIIFGRPVFFCLAVPGPKGESVVHSSPRWAPDPAAGREANLISARAHFQRFLDLVESLLRRDPYLWFNYVPLNREAPSA